MIEARRLTKKPLRSSIASLFSRASIIPGTSSGLITGPRSTALWVLDTMLYKAECKFDVPDSPVARACSSYRPSGAIGSARAERCSKSEPDCIHIISIGREQSERVRRGIHLRR